MRRLILGTRGSELALTQARMTKAALEASWPGLDVVLEIIKTTGDLRPDIKLAEFQKGPEPLDKGIFTKELEEALREGRVDVAVHSLKDVPTELAPGFAIVATLERAPTEDVLVSKHAGGLAGLPRGALVATSSVRRAKQLQWQRPDLRVIEIRGNVATRIEKLKAQPELDATLLALAGLKRLGVFKPEAEGIHMFVMPMQEMLPAASQGAVGLEVYGENGDRDAFLDKINHAATFRATQLERQFLHLLKAGCHTPVGILTAEVGEKLSAEAIVFPEAGGAPQAGRAEGKASDPKAVAAALLASLV
jgi:hydroxymethylbilane synthase